MPSAASFLAPRHEMSWQRRCVVGPFVHHLERVSRSYNAPQKLSQATKWSKLEHTGRKGVGPWDDSVTALAPILRRERLWKPYELLELVHDEAKRCLFATPPLIAAQCRAVTDVEGDQFTLILATTGSPVPIRSRADLEEHLPLVTHTCSESAEQDTPHLQSLAPPKILVLVVLIDLHPKDDQG
jgi:hypothetical protein